MLIHHWCLVAYELKKRIFEKLSGFVGGRLFMWVLPIHKSFMSIEFPQTLSRVYVPLSNGATTKERVSRCHVLSRHRIQAHLLLAIANIYPVGSVTVCFKMHGMRMIVAVTHD